MQVATLGTTDAQEGALMHTGQGCGVWEGFSEKGALRWVRKMTEEPGGREHFKEP